MTNKKVLFIAPRYHTNQFFLTKQLKEKKVEVNFLVVYVGGSENHTYLKPKISKPSILSKWFTKRKDPENEHHRLFLRKYHITSFRYCYMLYKELSPEILIIRNLRSHFSIQHLFLGLIMRKKVFLYTQNKYRQDIGFKRKLFYLFLKSVGVKHFTPVFGDNHQPRIPNTLYIPFVIDKKVSSLDIKLKIDNEGIHIVAIGKMSKRKNLRELIEALYRVKFFDISKNKLTVISECISENQFKYLESIKKNVPRNKSQIDFQLNIDHSEVFKILEGSDLFILPSHNEPAAFSILEAMACGLAVVCSDLCGTKCYIKNGFNGEVFKYSPSFEDLDVVLLRLLNKDLLLDYGLASLNLVKQNHGIERFYESIIVNSTKP